jgi:VIT1/CCC1 family predicted Fe2+/Mn2+ transporter
MAAGEYVSVRSQRELFEYQIGLEREELGLNPDELGSPWGAAVSSFLSFAAGALVPLAPFALASGASALPLAIGVTAVALFGVGALLSLFTGRNALYSGARMLVLGGIAGAVTFAIGRLAGVSLG